jgi:peptide-methionine (S)-S-oxide reductase
LDGVVSTQVGYTGGHTVNPTYGDVCSGTTGHAEAVEVEFDPDRISYQKLLEVFFASHDPRSRYGKRPDTDSQYRSAIFYHGEEQERAALAAKERLEQARPSRGSIGTQIAPAATFYRAEEYHQQYYEKSGLAGCRLH